MKRGRKPEPPSAKAARGTLQPVRDGLKTEILVPGDPPPKSIARCSRGTARSKLSFGKRSPQVANHLLRHI